MKDRQFEFRAVYMHKTGEEIDYESLPIQQATEPYCTVGLYESKELENGTVVQDHIADMPIEDFKAVVEHRFPNGFDSWAHTLHEISNLVTERKMTEGSYTDKMRQIEESGGHVAWLVEAKAWTNEFEKIHKGRFWDGEFLEEVEEFVNKKLEGGDESV